MKLIKDFHGVPNGAFYPVLYPKGDECPPELEDAAREAGCLKTKGKGNQDVPPRNPSENPTENPTESDLKTNEKPNSENADDLANGVVNSESTDGTSESNGDTSE